jgi:hypothetical protein
MMGRLGKTTLACLLVLVSTGVCALIYRYFGVVGGAVATGLFVGGTKWSSWRDRKVRREREQRGADEVDPGLGLSAPESHRDAAKHED